MNIFKKIPASMTGLLVVMGVLAPLLMLGAASNPKMIAVWTILYIAIGAIAGLGVFLFERSNQAKASDFAKSVETNAASAEGLKDPQKIAQMDHMRKEFQRGIDIYKKHGKDLYSLPWYVVVGESESGKTEMLRRSEIGFPDKLQDRWQGSGGTLSMHWWFTSKAVILDTAGRLFVTEGAETGQNQWVNFLQMLKRNRPDCPINGLLLVIPSNRLLTHPDPELETASMVKLDENAGQIARQMETLQAELGVRFPVYILITKMDKLNGFREFFGKIDKPEDRYQIMGWSNPAPLGDTFEAQSVAEYLHSVADRLKRRMMSELRHVEPEELNGLRINEVDGLFAFPSAFESMSPKLTRYLRHVFATDEWSAKPPFLRGIYFTSALQQGKVLDEALAAAMGVPFDKMDNSQQDDGLSLSKHRTFFVRDLFLDKIFNEKGLVTSAGKIQSQLSGWKLWLPAVVIFMLALFGLLGWWTMSQSDEAKLWKPVWKTEEGIPGIRIRPLVTFDKEVLVGAPPEKIKELLRTLDALGPCVKGNPKFGWVFTPAQWFERDLSKKNRQSLYADAVAEVLTAVENAIIGKLTADLQHSDKAPDNWNNGEWQALHALMILQNGAHWDAGKKTVSLQGEDDTPWPTAELLETLFHYAAVGNNKDSQKSFAAVVQNCIGHAVKLPDSAFVEHLSARQHVKELTALLGTTLPVSKLENQRKFIQDLNDFHELFTKTMGYESANIERLAELAAAALKQGKLESSPAAPAESRNLAVSREELLHAVVSNSQLAKAYGFDSLTRVGDLKLKDGADALVAQDNRLLKQVAATLEIIKPNSSTTLSSSNIGDFVSLTPEADAQAAEDPHAKARKDILKRLADLKKAWFKDEFFPKQFYRYLKLPIASDAPVGSDEELLTLWELTTLADQWGVSDERLPSLKKAFDYFFVSEKITELGIAGALRPCVISIVKIEGDAAKYVIKAGAEQIAEFNLMANLKPGTLTGPNLELSFFKNGTPDGKLAPWTLVKAIKVGTQNPWRHTTPSGASYDILIKDRGFDNLRQWPKIEAFKPKP
ncbi:MAG: hypothetical protein NTW21_12180 [Verrucomicrobia bacterium]|nr:hypothetical protein [Verrucomicrobiota bacterium]